MRLVKGKDLVLTSGLVLTGLLQLFPFERLWRATVFALAKASYVFLRRRVRSAESNLRKVFGQDLSDATLRGIIQESFRGKWEEVFYLGSGRIIRKVVERVETSGFERLEKALASGKGAILWEASHFGYRNLSKHYLKRRGFQICQLHSELHILGNPTYFSRHVLGPLVYRYERGFVADLVIISDPDSLSFTRQLARRLQENGVVAIAGGGEISRGFVPTQFFGQPAFFAKGAFTLSRLTGAPVIPTFCCWDSEAGHHRLVFEPSIHTDGFSEFRSSVNNTLNRCVCTLESYVRTYPEQFWNWPISFSRLFPGPSGTPRA
jgi:KDO2-lipid IV(A) lauroyltransferase